MKPKYFKIVAVIIAFLILVSGASRIYAQSPWFNPTSEEWQTALEECKSGNVGLECTVQAIVSGIENSLVEHSAQSPASIASGQKPGGAIYFASSIISTLVTKPPVSSGDYVQYVAQKINPVQTAYAQGGTGFRALSSLTLIWSAFRNVAYLAFVIIFIFMGFMIMFRARLDPQTVVNIQNSLPKLVVTLILITFSYAIAGLMVDLIYLGIYLVVSVLASQGLINNPADVREVLINENVFTAAIEAGFYRHAATLAEAIQQLIQGALNETFFEAIYGIIPFKTTLAQLIISAAILFSLFKLFFQLLFAYINIILSTILSPILLLLNALPGSQSFSSWVRNFLANVLIFPAVALLFLVSAVLIGRSEGRWQIQEGLFETGVPWSPPFVSMETEPDVLMAVVGFGFILFAPQMVSLLQQSLKAKPLPAAGIFAPIAAGARVVTAPVRAPLSAVGAGARTFFAEKVEKAARGSELSGRGR